MERKKASDFPQELLDLFDEYVHGGISRRDFIDGAQKFAVGGLTAAALFEMLKPNYALADAGPAERSRDQGRDGHHPFAAGQREDQRLPGDAGQRACEDRRSSSSSTRTAASTRTSKTSTRRLAMAGFIAMCARWADLASAAIPATTRRADRCSARSTAPRCAKTSSRRREWLKTRPDSATASSARSASASAAAWSTSSRCGWARTWRPACRTTARSRAPPTSPRSRRRSTRNTARLDPRITGGWAAFDAALTAAGVPHEGHIYKDAQHGFHNDTTPRYDEAAAKEAWTHTLDWFNKYLKA